MINGISSNKDADEIEILHNLRADNADEETQKTIDIISMLNKCESQMLDKNAVIVYAYEKFFS